MIITKIIATIGICAQLMNITGYVDMQNNYEYGDLYSNVGIVYEIDTENDLFYVKDSSGDLWQFIGVEDWETGDIMTMVMADSGTAEKWDDIVLNYRYNGHFVE